MPANNKFIVIYDFETTKVDGCTKIDGKTCCPIQIAAKVLHPRTLEPVQGGVFMSYMKPVGIPTQESLEWHAKVKKSTPAEVLQKWNEAPDQKMVWGDFAKFLDRFHISSKRKSIFTAPIRAGANIITYDNLIWDRLCLAHGMVDKDGKQNLAFPRDNLDIINLFFMWFEDYYDAPPNYNLDDMREYFGIPSGGSHEAMKDCNDVELILVRFMNLFRKVSKKINFRGAFKA